MSSQNKKRKTQFHSFKYINGVTFVNYYKMLREKITVQRLN